MSSKKKNHKFQDQYNYVEKLKRPDMDEVSIHVRKLEMEHPSTFLMACFLSCFKTTDGVS